MTGTALVTGSAGFIGRHFARHLRDNGWAIISVDNAGGSDALTFFRSPYGRAMQHFDLVIHAAAAGAHRAAIDTSPLDLAVNLELDAALFSWARRARPGRVVYLSSSAAYPVALQTAALRHQLDENDIYLDCPVHDTGRPDGIYGWAKLTGEYLARLARGDGLAVTVVRPFSGYGPDQGEDFPFGAFTGRALRREDPFTIWGDGRQVRDFIHVDDIVATVMAMYKRETDGPVNIGTGRDTSMLQLACMVCEAAGYDPEFRFIPSAPSGVPWRVADITRMAAIRMPAVSLEDGIRRALRDRAGAIT